MIKKSIKRNIRIGIKYVLLTIIVLVFMMPMIFMVTNSFMSSDEIIGNYRDNKNGELYNTSIIPNEVTLEQYYKVLFRSPEYIQQFWNSIVLAVPTVFFQVIISFIAAYAFARLRFPGRNIIFFIILILMLLPIQVTLVPNFIVLRFLNLNDKFIGVILSCMFAPLAVCLLRQYLMYMPDDTIEAAKIDGANQFQIIFRIVLPQVKGALAAIGILSFIQNWNMVEQPLLLLRDTTKQPLSVLMSNYISSKFGIIFAAGIIFLIPALIVFFLGQKYIVLGIKMYRRR